MKAIFVLLSLFVALNVQAQNVDARIGALMGESRWFDLSHELNVTPTDSVNPLLHKMALAMTYHYFNQADSACIVLSDLLNNHQEELGENTLNMAVLLGMNLARTNHYTEAADLMQDLCTQLKAQGADSTQTIGLFTLVKQYRAFADNAPICLPLYKPGTYHIPMKTHNAMHIAKNGTEKGHFITMEGSINGQESPLVFDTGAGVNIISSAQANNYGLRLLDVSIPMMGVGMQQGRYAIADTLHIGTTVHLNNFIRCKFFHIHKRQCGETGKDKQVTHQCEGLIFKLMRHDFFDFIFRQILTLLHIRADVELCKRISWYQSVVMRPHNDTFQPHTIQPDGSVLQTTFCREVGGKLLDEVGGKFQHRHIVTLVE